ncbi:MAG TPA: hypothetical protein VMQ61_03690 [Thermoanaerobaculia bacterium]|nr:hypothetical protein [Thermoanaerobaculia bacterium]
MSASPIFYEESQGFTPWAYVLLAAVGLVLLAVATLRMRTIVASDAVTLRYGFLSTVRVPISDLVRAEAVAYRPVRDYGGWGVRGFGQRRAFSARGNRGVLLTRTDGSTLMVGSQDPRRLLAALAMAGVATEDKLPAPPREF